MNNKLIFSTLLALSGTANLWSDQPEDTFKRVFQKTNEELENSYFEYSVYVASMKLKQKEKGLLTKRAQEKADRENLKLRMRACLNQNSYVCKNGVKQATESFVLKNISFRFTDIKN